MHACGYNIHLRTFYLDKVQTTEVMAVFFFAMLCK